ncbi:YibE/F-like protein [uncultured Eubacteriales bacterium]|uniref:YibE/F-like protein n=1 Tax=uncultured Eubacteriales bacterium TaxID=172733 RepID=A0A212JPG5_9FIRM|nr:YibE/F-like protein [uncultured Eubacteriales bacterium]
MAERRKAKKHSAEKSGRGSAWLSALKEAVTPALAIRVGIMLLLIAGLAAVMVLLNRAVKREVPTAASLRVFVPAKITEVLSEDATPDTWTEGLRLGQQELEVELLEGEYKGEVLPIQNFLSAYSNVDGKVGGRVIVRVDVDESGDPFVVMVANYDRGLVMGGLLLLFSALLVAIGGKKGLMALLGLAFTILCLLFLLIPLILLGLPPIPCTIAFVAIATAASLLLLTGFTRKTLCATLGCVGGTAAAGILAAVVGVITPLSGFNMSEAEELVLRASEYHLHISGLLVCGVLIASLGAVMDVAMSIASACQELRELNPMLTARQLFQSGMNIGRDAMGTMANTLILAFAGSALNTLILFRAYNYPFLQIVNSDLIVIEVLQGLAGSIGIILTVPLVAAISASLLSNRGKKAVAAPQARPKTKSAPQPVR